MRLAPAKKIIAVILLFGSSTIYAHARLTAGRSLPPRTDDDDLKAAPCGPGIGPTADPTMRTALVAGQTILVEWEETINHTGHFEIAFSMDGMNGFDTDQGTLIIADDQDGPVVRNNPATYHRFSASYTVPDVECQNCSIRLAQYMAGSNSYYYSCADVTISRNGPVGEPPAPVIPKAPAGLQLKLRKVSQ